MRYFAANISENTLTNKRNEPAVVELSGIDWFLLLTTVGLIFIGWLMIFASEYNADTFTTLLDWKRNFGRQLVWIVMAGLLGFLVQLFHSRFYQTFSVVFYPLVGLLLVGVLFTRPINGSTSWFDIGGFRLQPSEFAKLSVCLLLAAYLQQIGGRLQNLKQKLIAGSIVLLPMFLVSLQGDAGSTLVYVAFAAVLFRAGLDAWLYVLGVMAVVLFIASLLVDTLWGLSLFLIMLGTLGLLWAHLRLHYLSIGYMLLLPLTAWLFDSDYAPWWLAAHGTLFLGLGLWFAFKRWQWSAVALAAVSSAILYSSSVNYFVNNVLKPHQQDRIWVWLRPEKCDPLESLYNLEQSKFAIGSGGWAGKGFLEGERTKLDYVPEQSTDFIFCTIGEEWGFLGTVMLVSFFTLLLLRIIHVAERQRTLFAKFYAYGVASIIFFHLFINIGMTMGLVPIIGIPLPFISYGGSSLWSFTVMMSILLKLDSDRLGAFGR